MSLTWKQPARAVEGWGTNEFETKQKNSNSFIDK